MGELIDLVSKGQRVDETAPANDSGRGAVGGAVGEAGAGAGAGTLQRVAKQRAGRLVV